MGHKGHHDSDHPHKDKTAQTDAPAEKKDAPGADAPAADAPKTDAASKSDAASS